MKQCPNPNCIFYTRLEELPDAYVKCPGCGGALVNADSAFHMPNATTRVPSSASLYSQPNLFEQETSSHLLAPPDPDAFAPPALNPYAADPYAYAPVEEEDPEAAIETQSGWSATSKAIVAVSALLLVMSCVVVVVLLSNRLFPQARTITSEQATATAIAGIRPPINTPIIAPPTNTLPAASFPTVPQPELPLSTPTAPPAQPPTEVAIAPTQPPPPTQVVAQPTTVAQGESTPGPTAPPPRTQPSGGVTNAQMSVQLAGGESAGNVNAYNSSDPFNLAVQATFGAGAVTSITTRWYGPEGTQIYEMRKAYSQPGVYYTGFTLRKSTPWQTGDYRVDIYTNDAPSPAYSVSFTVVP